MTIPELIALRRPEPVEIYMSVFKTYGPLRDDFFKTFPPLS